MHPRIGVLLFVSCLALLIISGLVIVTEAAANNTVAVAGVGPPAALPGAATTSPAPQNAAKAAALKISTQPEASQLNASAAARKPKATTDAGVVPASSPSPSPDPSTNTTSNATSSPSQSPAVDTTPSPSPTPQTDALPSPFPSPSPMPSPSPPQSPKPSPSPQPQIAQLALIAVLPASLSSYNATLNATCAGTDTQPTVQCTKDIAVNATVLDEWRNTAKLQQHQAYCTHQEQQKVPPGKYLLAQELLRKVTTDTAAVTSGAKDAAASAPVQWSCINLAQSNSAVPVSPNMEVTLELGSDVLCVADYNEPPSAKPFDAGLAAGVAVAVVVTFIVLAAAAYYAYKQHTQREKQQDGLVRYSSSFEGAGNRPFAGIASKIKHAIGTSPLPPIAAATAATAAAAAPAAFKAHSFNSSTTSKQVAVTVSDGGMVVGFTGEELCSALQEVQHVVTHKLIIAVEDSPLAADPFAAWLAEGMDEVQRRVCKADYAQSHMFVRDWQTHCMLGWLHDSIWSQQVPPHTLLGVQAPSGVTDKQSARWLLAQLRIDTHYPPFKTATADVAQHLLKSVLQHAPEHVAEEAARYYAPVLLQVMASALRLFLQVRGTADGLSIFLPGRVAASTPALPEAAVRYKDYQQQQQQQLRVCVLDSQPGALAMSQTEAVTVWAPAAATRIELL